MNRKDMMTSVAVSLLIAFFSSQTKAQRPNPADASTRGLPGARTWIPIVNGRAGMLREFRTTTDDRLACGPASGQWAIGHAYFGGSRTQIVFSFGGPRSGSVIGSWTVRKFAPKGEPERTESYYFDGIFTSGTVNIPTASPYNFELRGRTTHLGACENTVDELRALAPKDIRIWGSCEGGQVSFEITNPDGRVYANATFRADVSVICAQNQPSAVNQTLNRH